MSMGMMGVKGTMRRAMRLDSTFLICAAVMHWRRKYGGLGLMGVYVHRLRRNLKRVFLLRLLYSFGAVFVSH